jgi:hypothetical protein
MRKMISNTSAPPTPLPIGHAEPEREAKPRLEKLPKATSSAAILACHRFWRAASDCDQAIKMAYDPTIDRKHWASVREQWLVWRHNAKRRAELCKTEGLPEPLLTEVFQRLHSVDHLWKIACDYRDDHKGSDTTNKHALKTPAQGRNHGPKPEVSKRVEDAMTKDLQQGKITLADLSEAPEEALATQYDAYRDTVRKVRNKILSRSVDNSNPDK